MEFKKDDSHWIQKSSFKLYIGFFIRVYFKGYTSVKPTCFYYWCQKFKDIPEFIIANTFELIPLILDENMLRFRHGKEKIQNIAD